MSDMPPPPPPAGAPDSDSGDNFGQFASGPPPWSGSAITGFVSSLLICVPIVSSLVGLIAGIMGISATSGGRRRGRGLAIAAIPISLITGAVSTLVVAMMVLSVRNLFEMRTTLAHIFDAGQLDDSDLQELIDAKMSEGLADSLTPADLRAWVEQVTDEHGSLAEVSMEMRDEPTPGGAQAVVVFPCRFVKGTVDVRVYNEVDIIAGMEFSIDNIEVGGHALRDAP